MPPARLPAAIDLMLEELEETTRTLVKLDLDRAGLTQRQRDLSKALSMLLTTLPRDDARDVAMRLTRIATRGRPTRPFGAKVDGPLARVFRYLVDHEVDEIRGAELGYFLRRNGQKISASYGANLLKKLTVSGHVTRSGHGKYFINRMHPDLLDMQFQYFHKIIRGNTDEVSNVQDIRD